MGIFSTKKKIYVTGVAYNLAGEEEDRVDFAQYTTLQAVMQNRSISENLTNGVLSGSGMKVKTAYNYAKNQYTYGVPNSNILGYGRPDPDVVRAVLEGMHPGFDISILTSYITSADYEFFAEKHLAETYGYDRISGVFESPPAGASATATVSYDYSEGVLHFVLLNPDTTTVTFDYALVGFVSGAPYLHVTYKTSTTSVVADSTTTRVAEPGEVDSLTTELLVTTIADEIHETTKVTTITVSGGVATVHYVETLVVKSRSLYHAYRLGAGGSQPTLDAMYSAAPLSAPYYPAVPIRVNNVDVTDDAHQSSALFKTSKKLLKRTGVKIMDIADKLNDNESINDIDFAFIVYGVSLRTQTEAGKRYIYKYMEYLDGISTLNEADFVGWEALPPLFKKMVSPPTNSLEIYDSENRANNYDIKLQWHYIKKTLLPGTIHAGARVGDVDMSMGGQELFGLEQGTDYEDLMVDSSKLYLRKQVSESAFELMEVAGLYFQNFIYKGKAAELSAYECFTEEDEEVGMGFIFPLNRTILSELGGLMLTQLGMECTYLVLNCYKVVKQKWYQRGIFKVILMIVSIILVVIFPPAGIAAFAAAIAVNLGIGILLATVLAAIISAIAVMLIMQILQPVLVDIFGDVLGNIIAVAVSIWAGGGFQMSSFTNMFQLTLPNIMNATSAVSQAYGGYVQGKIAGLSEEMASATKFYEEQMKTVEEMTKELLGDNRLVDLEGFLEASNVQMEIESPTTFLTRTTLVGSDICALTHSLIDGFTQYSLDLRATTA